MPQEKKETAFYFFLKEKQKGSRKNVPSEVLVEKIYREWKSMPEKQKAKYENMASKVNRSVEKLDSRGIPLSELEKERKTEDDKMEKGKRDTRKVVSDMVAERGVLSKTFNVVFITHYVHLPDDTYVPAEIGLCSFCLSEGIMAEYHKILPARLPPGVRYEAKVHCENSHNLPLSPDEYLRYDSTDFIEEFNDFLNSYKTGTEILALYTQNEYLGSVESMINGFNLKLPYKINSLDYLFQQIYSKCIEEIPECLVSEIISSCRLDYVPSMACWWHQKVAPDSGKFCALSCVRRWIFNFFHFISDQETFSISFTEGRHLPTSSAAMEVCVKMEAMSIRSENSPSPQPFGSNSQQKLAAKALPESSGLHSVWGAWSLSSPRCSVDTTCSEEFPALTARRDDSGNRISSSEQSNKSFSSQSTNRKRKQKKN